MSTRNYRMLASKIVSEGANLKNFRTDSTMRVLVKPQILEWDLSDGLLPIINTRRVYPHIAAAEFAWFMRGETDITFLQENGVKIWNQFADECNVVDGAYGFRWRRNFHKWNDWPELDESDKPVDQIHEAIRALIDDQTSRQVFVSTWDPGQDIGKNKVKNVPCQTGFHLRCILGTLHCTVFCRSSDVIIGLPYDLMVMAMVMQHIRDQAQIPRLGTLTFVLSDAHIYDQHINAILPALDRADDSRAHMSIPTLPVQYVEQDDGVLVETYRWDIFIDLVKQTGSRNRQLAAT